VFYIISRLLTLVVVNLLLNVLPLVWHSFESVAAQMFYDILLKMIVLDDINCNIRAKFIWMQTVSKYFLLAD